MAHFGLTMAWSITSIINSKSKRTSSSPGYTASFVQDVHDHLTSLVDSIWRSEDDSGMLNEILETLCLDTLTARGDLDAQAQSVVERVPRLLARPEVMLLPLRL